jgi:SWIM/SEC-C metal-binding protein
LTGGGSDVPRLGSKARPVVVRVPTQEQALATSAVCREFDLHCIVDVEPDQPEDLRDLERALDPPGYAGLHRIGRNDPCPCGSGKKYKKCCDGRELAAATGASR